MKMINSPCLLKIAAVIKVIIVQLTKQVGNLSLSGAWEYHEHQGFHPWVHADAQKRYTKHKVEEIETLVVNRNTSRNRTSAV